MRRRSSRRDFISTKRCFQSVSVTIFSPSLNLNINRSAGNVTNVQRIYLKDACDPVGQHSHSMP